MTISTPKEAAKHYGELVEYEFLYFGDDWRKREMPITGHLIAGMEDNRVRNVKLLEPEKP